MSQEAEQILKLKDVKVLIVEDSPDIRFLISRMIKLAGALVDTAENGLEGIKKAEENSYDVILMDLRMPHMDGYEATRYLRRKGYDRPIIAVTAHAIAEEREQCLDIGYDAYLIKPVKFEILLKTVEKYAAISSSLDTT